VGITRGFLFLCLPIFSCTRIGGTTKNSRRGNLKLTHTHRADFGTTAQHFRPIQSKTLSPVQPSTFAVHRAFMFITELLPAGTVNKIARVFGTAKLRENRDLKVTKLNTCVAFLRTIAEVAPLADAVDGARMGVAILGRSTSVDRAV
jgi:hypothetical protein